MGEGGMAGVLHPAFWGFLIFGVGMDWGRRGSGWTMGWKTGPGEQHRGSRGPAEFIQDSVAPARLTPLGKRLHLVRASFP